MRKMLLIIGVVALLFGIQHADAQSIDLARDGKSQYTIVLSRDASLSERYAANELQILFKEISGAELPIVMESKKLPKYMVVLGRGTAAKSLGVSADLKALGDEGFVIKTVGPHLVIAGGRLRGTMYGVYYLLDELIGCRWYTSKVSLIPVKPTVELGPLDIHEKPDFEYREPYYGDAVKGDFPTHLRVNSHSATLAEVRGGYMRWYNFAHTFEQIAPAKTYLKEHPEYFSLVDGKRVGGQFTGQLCLTNPDVLKLAINAVMDWIEKRPDCTVFSVSQNDNKRSCECEKCKAVDLDEGSPSGTMLRFVNAVADEVAKKHPDKLIHTFAYMYTEKPPKITKPRPNVRVQLAPIYTCYLHPYAVCNSAQSKAFMGYLRGWNSITDNLYIWDYSTNYYNYLMPVPDIEALSKNIKLYRDSGVKGVFVEGPESLNVNGVGLGYMDELKTYLIAKLLWDADRDPRQIVHDFMIGYYGLAGQPIEEMVWLFEEKAKSANAHSYCLDASKGVDEPLKFHPTSQTMPYLTPEVMAQAERFMDEAEKLAENREILGRVEHVRLSIDYVNVIRQVRAARSGTEAEIAAALTALDEFEKRVKDDRFANLFYGTNKERFEQFRGVARGVGITESVW